MTFARWSVTRVASAVLMMMAAVATAQADDKVAEANGTPAAPKILNQSSPSASSVKSAESSSTETKSTESGSAEVSKAPPAVSSSPALSTPTTKAAAPAAPAPAPAEKKADAKPQPSREKPSSDEKPAKTANASPAPAPAAKPAVAAPPPKPTLIVDIDLSRQKLSVSERGKRLYTWSISSGREGYRTPTGTYRPQWMTKMWYSRKYEWSPMPHAIFFHKGFAIHGTYATRQLGHPASHGCVRLSPAHAATLYKLVSKHGKTMTRISLRGSAPAFKAAPQVASRHRDDRWMRDYADDGDGYYREMRPRRTHRRTYSDGSTYGGDPYYEPRRRYPPRYVERPYPPRGYWNDYYD